MQKKIMRLWLIIIFIWKLFNLSQLGVIGLGSDNNLIVLLMDGFWV